MGKVRPRYALVGLLAVLAGPAGCAHPRAAAAPPSTGPTTAPIGSELFSTARERLPPLAGATPSPASGQPGITGILRSGDWVNVEWSAPPGSTATVEFTPQGGRRQTLLGGSSATSWSFTTEAAHGVVMVELTDGKRRLRLTRAI